MALDRLIPVSTTPGAVTGNGFMDGAQEEITGLWDRSTITLTAVAGADTITATATPALTGALGGSMNFILKAAATNTTAVTLNINGTGAVSVVDAEGTALAAGALRANANYLLHYDSGLAKFVVVGYTPAAAVPVGSKLICFQSVSAAGSIDFVHGVAPVVAGAIIAAYGTTVLDSTYASYMLMVNAAKPATDDVEAWFRIGTGGGPTYQTTGYTSYARMSAGASGGDSASTTAVAVAMSRQSGTVDVGNGTGESFSSEIFFPDPSQNNFFTCRGQSSYIAAAGSIAGGHFVGGYNTQTAITAVRFQFESGNIASGTAALYGCTKTA